MTKRHMTIPEVRERLFEIAIETKSKELRRLAWQLFRRRAVRKSRVKSRRMTARLRVEIFQYARSNPTKSFQEIANQFAVNQARVSEVLAGKRGAR